MTKNDADFDLWFGLLVDNLADRGVDFRDEDAVRQDYDDGKDMHDVVDEIAQEYE